MDSSTTSGAPWSGKAWAAFLATLLFAGLFQSATFIGLEGYNDDSRYVEAAQGWLTHFPFVGESHWAIRHPLVLSIAACMALFGHGEFSAGFPNLLAYLAVVGMTFCAVRSSFGVVAAAISALMFAVTPIAAVTAGSVDIWPVELALIVASFFALRASGEGDGRPWLAVGAGVLAGLAFLTRETSGAYLLGLGILFLMGIAAPRKFFLWMAAGWLLVIAADTLYFGLMTHDWLYRLRLTTNHSALSLADNLGIKLDLSTLPINVGLGSNAREAAGIVPPATYRSQPYLEYALIDVGTILSPYVMLFVHYMYGFTFWVGLLGALCVRSISRMARAGRHMELPLALLILGVTWFVAGTYVLHLRPHPRYWALTAYVAAVLGGLWVAWLLQRGHRVLVGVGLAGMIISHVLLVEMNDSSIVHARWLADYVKQGGQVVHIAANRWIKDKTYFTVLRGTDDRVRPLPDENAQRILVIEGDDVPSPIRDAPREWCKIWERHSRTTWLGQLLDLVGVLDRLPEKFRRPLIAPEANVAVYERKVCGS